MSEKIKKFELSLELDSTNLIDHLPPFLQDNKVLNALAEAKNPEFDLINQSLKELAINVLPQTANLDGIKRYEKWLGIKPNRGLSLEERRFQVIAKLNETLPFTDIRLNKMLAAIVGWDNFEFKLEDAHVTVKLTLESAFQYDVIYQMLEEIIPLNLDFTLIERNVDYTKIDLVTTGETTFIVETTIPDKFFKNKAPITSTTANATTFIVSTDIEDKIYRSSSKFTSSNIERTKVIVETDFESKRIKNNSDVTSQVAELQTLIIETK